MGKERDKIPREESKIAMCFVSNCELPALHPKRMQEPTHRQGHTWVINNSKCTEIQPPSPGHDGHGGRWQGLDKHLLACLCGGFFRKIDDLGHCFIHLLIGFLRGLWMGNTIPEVNEICH